MKNFETRRPVDVRVVLVGSLYERNVGASSRALANMGISQLILIKPQCELGEEAQKAAATGQEALQSLRIYPDWTQFFESEPEGLRISFTARDGRGRATRNFVDILTELKTHSPLFTEESNAALPVHLFFGPEDWGLSAEDIQHSHFCCSIPTYGENTSLNLAQAVLLALFILRQNWGGKLSILSGQIKLRRAPPPRLHKKTEVFPDESLKQFLIEMGFDLSKKKINVFTTLRRMLLHNTPTSKELNMLETVLQQGIRKLRAYNQLRKKS